MSRLILALILLLTFNSGVEALNYCTDDSSLVAGFIVEIGSGTILDDCSSNNNDGTFRSSGEPTWSTDVPQPSDSFDGDSTYSVDFDGSNDYISIASDTSLDSSDVTYGAWVNLDGSQSTSASCILFDKRALGGSPTQSIRFLFNDSVDDYRFQKYDNSGNLDQCDTSGITFSAGTWHPSYVTYDDTENEIKIYFDGSLEVTCPTSYGMGTNTDPLHIGSENDGVGNHMAGKLDELSIFDVALDSITINDIINNGLRGLGGMKMIINMDYVLNLDYTM